jgi:hypothetical protein
VREWRPSAGRRRVGVVSAAALVAGMLATVAAPAPPAAADPVPTPTAVSLTTTTGTLGSQDTATLTATADVSVTGTGLLILLFDDTTGTLLNNCSTGSTCWVNQSFNSLANAAHRYVAYVAPYSTTRPPAGTVASSNVVTLTPVAWSVTLTATKESLGSQDTATLTATANQSVSNTGKYVLIFNTTTGALLNNCASATTCSVSQSFNGLAGNTYTYVGYVAPYSTTRPPPGILATSNTVTLTPVAWSLTLSATRSSLGSQDTATLTATANQSVSNTGKYILIFNTTTGALLNNCASATTCSVSQSFNGLAGNTSTYVAYVAPYATTRPPPGTLATSNTVTLTPVAWSLELASTQTQLGSQDTATLTATANQSVSGTGKYILVFDSTTGALLNNCSTGTVCSVNQSFNGLGNSTHGYVGLRGAAQHGPSSTGRRRGVERRYPHARPVVGGTHVHQVESRVPGLRHPHRHREPERQRHRQVHPHLRQHDRRPAQQLLDRDGLLGEPVVQRAG